MLLKDRKFTTFLVLAILLGISLQFANPVIAISLIMLIVVLFILSIAFLLIGLFSRKLTFWYLIQLVPLLVGYGTMTSVRWYKHRKAVEIVNKLADFKKQNQSYQTSLKQNIATLKLMD